MIAVGVRGQIDCWDVVAENTVKLLDAMKLDETFNGCCSASVDRCISILRARGISTAIKFQANPHLICADIHYSALQLFIHPSHPL